MITRKISEKLVNLILVDPRKILMMFLSKMRLIHWTVAIEKGAVSKRPEYAYGLWRALSEAKSLGYNSVSVIEFEVSRGGCVPYSVMQLTSESFSRSMSVLSGLIAGKACQSQKILGMPLIYGRRAYTK